MWRDSHRRTLALLTRQEQWAVKQLQQQERHEAWQAWLEAQRAGQQAAAGEAFTPSLIQRLLRSAPQEQPDQAQLEQQQVAASSSGQGSAAEEQGDHAATAAGREQADLQEQVQQQQEQQVQGQQGQGQKA